MLDILVGQFMVAGAIVGIFLCISYLMGWITDPFTYTRRIRGTASTQDEKFSMKRIAQLERESMAYWEERFIAAGGLPEKKEIIEPEIIRNTSSFDQYLSNVERQYREYIDKGGDPKALPYEIRSYMFMKGMMHGSSSNPRAGANSSEYAGLSTKTRRKYAGQIQANPNSLYTDYFRE